MPHIVETTVYPLDELSEAGRDKARTWYRERAFEDDWYDCTYENFEMICNVLGVHLKTRPVRFFGGGTRARSCIYFNGFWSQGDGACFEAQYAYDKDGAPTPRRHGRHLVVLLAHLNRCRSHDRLLVNSAATRIRPSAERSLPKSRVPVWRERFAVICPRWGWVAG